jgi:hypothetical protein
MPRLLYNPETLFEFTGRHRGLAISVIFLQQISSALEELARPEGLAPCSYLT